MSSADGSGHAALFAFLRTDNADAGCGPTMDLLHAYVDQVIAGVDPEKDYPGVTAHLRACEPCVQDFDGLLALAKSLAPGSTEPR